MNEYEKIMTCVNRLGLTQTFTKKALDILVEYAGAGDDVIYPLIKLLGEDAFTEEAKKLIEEL